VDKQERLRIIMKTKLILIALLLFTVTGCTSQSTAVNDSPSPTKVAESLSKPTLEGELVTSQSLVGPTLEFKKFVIINETLGEDKIKQKAFLVDQYPNPNRTQFIAEANLPGIVGLDNYVGVKNGYNLLQVYFETMIFTNDGDIITNSIQKENPQEIEEGTLIYPGESELDNPITVNLSREGTGPVGSAKIDVTTGKILKGSFKQEHLSQ
jgi:hypothetical protein